MNTSKSILNGMFAFADMVRLILLTILWAIRHPLYALCQLIHRQPYSTVYRAFVLTMILFVVMVSHAQTTYTTNAAGQVFVTTPVSTNTAPGGGLLLVAKSLLSDLEKATNYAVVPYLSYGLNNHKVGGGVLALYNFNNYVGAGVGADYLGSFSLVSGNVQLKLPLKPLAFTKWAWAQDLVMTPFVFSGLGTPFSGTGGSGIATHIGAGDYFQFGHLLGGRFNVGGAYIDREGAGKYSGKYANALFAWSVGL